jgi:hypothetical protein
MKRIVLALTALAVGAALVPQVSAATGVKYCYYTGRYPCGACVDEAVLYACVP